MALGYVTAGDLGAMLLPMHVRGDALAQTIQDKPFLKWWESKKKTYAGGLSFELTEGVQGAFMSDTTTLQGYSQDDQLNFGQAMNAQRTAFYGKEHNYGLIITWTELKQDNIHIDTKQAVSKTATDRELFQLMDVMKNRMADFAESYARNKARLFFLDGSQDPKAMSGFKSIIQDTPGVGTVGGINKATYPWWQNRANLTLQPSGENQNMCRFFQSELRNLRLFGGRPDKAFCGQDFLNALELEIRSKGQYTVEGFTKGKANDFGQGEVSLMGLGTFTWEPMLDQLGESKRCYILDSRHIKVRPQDEEDDKALTPVRPYNYLVFLHNITWTGTMSANQLNCHGVYAIA
jgi:hypothetical protein